MLTLQDVIYYLMLLEDIYASNTNLPIKPGIIADVEPLSFWVSGAEGVYNAEPLEVAGLLRPGQLFLPLEYSTARKIVKAHLKAKEGIAL